MSGRSTTLVDQGVEIPDELLERVAGGSISEVDQRYWMASLAKQKQEGWTKKEAAESCPWFYYVHGHLTEGDDLRDFILSKWDSL